MRTVVMICGMLIVWGSADRLSYATVAMAASDESEEVLEHDPADPEPAPAAIPDDVADDDLLTADSEALSEDDCLRFAEAVEIAVYTGDTFDFLQLIDWDALLAVATQTAGRSVPPKTVVAARHDFIAGFKSELLKHGGLCHAVVESVENGGDYAFLRVVEHRTRPRVRFRMLLPEGGVTYQDFVLRRFPDGAVRADDVYMFSTGELFTETAARAFSEAVSVSNSGIISWALGARRDAAERSRSLRLFREMTAAHRAENPERVLALFAELPVLRQRDKTCLLMRLQAALKVGESEYLTAIEDFQKAHPDTVAAELLSIDGHLLHDRHADALRSVEKLDKAVGGDPYLLGLRGNIQFLAGNHEAARALAMEALEADGELAEPFVVLLNVSLAEKKHSETFDMLRVLTERFGYEFSDLSKSEDYADFAQSSEFASWQKFQEAWQQEQEAQSAGEP